MPAQPKTRNTAIKKAFLDSYAGQKGVNRFTKVRIDLNASKALLSYFEANRFRSDAWFNVISPKKQGIDTLHKQLEGLLRR